MQTKTVNKAYNFRIIPSKSQEELINKNIGCVRFVFNHFLAQSKDDQYLSYSKFSKMRYMSSKLSHLFLQLA